MDEDKEYFVLILMTLPGDSFFVMELHVWWDKEVGQLHRSSVVLAADEVEGEATHIYEVQRAALITQGFTDIREGHIHTTGPNDTFIHAPILATPGVRTN